MEDPNEMARLRALSRYEVLDTPAEPLFDSLTHLAARLFGVPIALISLVDQDRQWFKSCVGLNAVQTPRGVSFCQHAILSDDVFIVLDAQCDERFSDNPFVTGAPDIRFYAGAPLIAPGGHRLGTLCVIDKAPRAAFTSAETANLQAIADTIVQALVLRLDSREGARVMAVADERYKLLSLAEQMAGVGTWSWDIATNRTTWSDEVHRIHGAEPGAASPDLEGALAIYHPDDAKVLAAQVERAVAEGREYETHARIYRSDGSERHVVARGACRRGLDGAVTGLFGTFQDVTEHVQSERFIRALTDNLPGMVGYWDSHLRCRFANPAYLEWFGRTPEQMLGITTAEVMGEPLFSQNEQAIRAVFSGQPQTFQRPVAKPSGEIGLALVRYIPDVDKAGLVAGIYVLATDVTDLKRAEDKLKTANALMKEARDEAIAASNVKAEFLANMSHEIRTPLTAILGFTGLLSLRDDLSDVARAQVGRIKNASATLLSIVNDILDFSKLEAGQIAVTPRPVDVVQLAQDALAMFSPQAQVKSLDLEFEVEGRVPDCVRVDPERLRQILLNLIGNAVKFTDKGTVRLELAYDNDLQKLSIQIKDTGAGMDEVQLARLFKRFSQVDASSTRRHGGTGLGLAICKGIVEAMGGQVGVDSKPGHGSAFHVTIDAPIVTESGRDADGGQMTDRLRGVRVLIADDTIANRELVRVLLEQDGAEITVASDGSEAVAAAESLPFDVILVDLHMPVLDGLGVLRRIRSDSGPNQDAPVFAFTADPPDTVPCGPGLFDGVIGKPINAAHMVAALVRATSWHSPQIDEQTDDAVAVVSLSAAL